MIRDLSFVFFGLLVGIAIGAPRSEGLKLDGLRAEFSLGECRYQKSPNGMWWDQDHENASHYRDNGCGTLGLAGKFPERWDMLKDYGWALRYVNLGRVHTRALARTLPNDDPANRRNVDVRRAECYPAINFDNCLYQWHGDGGVKGLSASLTTELKKFGPVRLDAELGALLYQIKWNEQVYPLGCSDPNCPWKESNNYQKSTYYLSPMLGLALRYPLTERVSISFGSRVYLRTTQHMPVSPGFSNYIQTWETTLSVAL